MADQALKNRIRERLRSAYFKGDEDFVHVSDGDADDVHIVIVSPQLGGKRAGEKTDLIWSVLVQEIDGLTPAEWGKISLVTATTPEELKAL